MVITGKEFRSFHVDASISEKADERLLRKPKEDFEGQQIPILDEEAACSESLQKIWDGYEKENQISEEVPTQDLKSFFENAQEAYEDYFSERHDITGEVLKNVTFCMKDQDKLSKDQALLLMKQALVDPQMAQLLMTGKKDDIIEKLKLTMLANKLKGKDITLDDSEAEKADVVPGEGEQLKGADAAEGESTKVSGEDLEKEKITVTDEIAAELALKEAAEELALKEAAEELALKEAAEAEKLKKVSEDAISTEISGVVLSPVSEDLGKEADMLTEEASARGVASDIDSVLSKGGISVPDSVSSVESISTALTMVYGDSSDAGITISTEGLAALSTECLPTDSTEGLLTEGLPTISTEGLSTVSTEGLPTVSSEGLPTVSTEDEPLIYITTSEERISTTSKLDIPSAEDVISSVDTDKDILGIPRLKRTLSKEELVIVDELLAKYDPSSVQDASLDDTTSAASTISSAYGAMTMDAMTIDGPFSKTRAVSFEGPIFDALVPGDSAEDAFERAQKMTQSLSQKYGLEETTMLPPEKKPKGRTLAQGRKKSKSFLKEQKPLPDIGKEVDLVEQSGLQMLKKTQSAAKLEKAEKAAKEKAEKAEKEKAEKEKAEKEKAVKAEKEKAEKAEKAEKEKAEKEEKKIQKKQQQLLAKKSKKKGPDDEKLASIFKNKDSKDKFIEMGLEKILGLAKMHKQRKIKEFDSTKKQFKDPIEVRDRLHARREQLNMLILGMSDEKTMELESMSQHELFEELETFEDEEITETLSMLTKVLHLDVEEVSAEKEAEEPEISKKEGEKAKEAQPEPEEEEKERVEETDEYTYELEDITPYKLPSRPAREVALPDASQEALDENLFRNALLKMKTLNIFNAIKALGITNPQMKDFDDYIAQNRLTELMDPVEIQHLRKAASEMFLFKGKAKKGRRKSVKGIKVKDLKRIRALSDTQLTSKVEEVAEPVDVNRLQKRSTLATMRQELDMLVLEQRLTEPYSFSYYVEWPEPPKIQKPSKKKK